MRLRLPFRFGVVTLTAAPQLFARARITLGDGRDAWGTAAELLVPKWFDKDPALSNAENFEQLRTAVRLATRLYTADTVPRTAFALFAETYREQTAAGDRHHLNPLVSAFGPALLDRAVTDALCRLHGLSFAEALRRNLPGVQPGVLVPELAAFDMDAFLSRVARPARIHARHTVGLLDAVTEQELPKEARAGDGQPETLETTIRSYNHTYFKIKVGGDVDRDIARLAAIAAVLDRIADPYHVTLDGNEQYADVGGVLELWRAMTAHPALRRLTASVLFIEQPVQRTRALEHDVGPLSAERPVIIDESDADLEAFALARQRGYLGVSSKACKGFYKALLNTARCVRWNQEAGTSRYFMSAEDLTTQAGVAVQQDLAIAAALGIEHVERNGHHYVNGMAGVPAEEQRRFLAAHPDLYVERGGAVRLRIEKGVLQIGSLDCPGFAVATEPEWAAMREVGVRLTRTSA